MIHLKRTCPWIVPGLALVLVAGVSAEPQATEEQLAAAARVSAKIPEEARQRNNPLSGNAESLARGELYFTSQCTMCHGSDGRGTGSLVDRLDLKIPDFTEPEIQKTWTDGELFYVLTHGNGKMPGQKDRFDENTKWSLVNYVRSFSARN